MNFTLDPTRHAAPQVVEALRAAIISLELAPEALDRAVLAQRFGVSQTPVRDALIRLSEEGLIRAQYTTQVSRIDVPAAREAHFLRRSIEIEIARLLATAPDPAVIGELRMQLARQVELPPRTIPPSSRPTRSSTAHVRRGRPAAAVVGGDAHVRPRGPPALLHVPTAGKTESILTGHQAILEAIESGDVDAAQQAVREPCPAPWPRWTRSSSATPSTSSWPEPAAAGAATGRRLAWQRRR
jgi:DNA-binding GntR family transcriptional regulator